MFSLIATIAGLALVVNAETDAQKVVGGAVLSAALNYSFRSVNQ